MGNKDSDKLAIAIRALKDCRARRNVGENVRVIVDTALRDLGVLEVELFKLGVPDKQGDIIVTLEPSPDLQATFQTPMISNYPPTIDRTQIRPSRQIAGWEWDCPSCATTIVVGREEGTRKQLEESGLDPRCPTCQKGE